MTTFAILSRLIAPSAYAQFAVLAFVYTICSLATDLSSMGFLLVHGDSATNRRLAWRSATLSAAGGACLLAIAATTLTLAPLPLGPPGLANSAILVLGLVAQALSQPPRAQLMLRRAYSRIAVTDIAATAVTVVVTVLLAQVNASVTVLCTQLTLLSVVRLLLVAALSARRETFSDMANGSSGGAAMGPVAYGLRVLPLNVASYASRSIDSGVLPLILPATAAATYSRSYQLIISPITQIQLSLGGALVERLARHADGDPAAARRFNGALWAALHTLTFSAAIALSLGAPLIQSIFFGPAWQHVDVFVAAMAALLPSLTLSTYISWKLQISANIRHSLANLTVLMLVPFLAITLALTSGTSGAVIGLAAGALIQGLLLAIMHRSYLPTRLWLVLLQIVTEWIVLAALVALRLS
ncbi:oligosaccharide flippase family protein [Curtobacterium sp. C1]|uniref:oligosaccharide flippase family protein n=1 Tax=Curtobacterium sp. C1 TaxID=2898151 RepID=UPI001E3A8D21|nr:oligosaccharide flippase family protein [Curtobacterium sp. C1]UFU14571.1 oligosaccharide flippase family protein [Curtobacterium sp. C1]